MREESNSRLYLSIEESLRLKKNLDRLSSYLNEGGAESIPFTICSRLMHLINDLSLASRTRGLVFQLVTLQDEKIEGAEKKSRALQLIAELESIYRLQEIRYRPV